jgi:hypothetical protein
VGDTQLPKLVARCGNQLVALFGAPFFRHENRSFAKTGSGQAQETCCKREAISAGRGEDKTMQVYANMLDMLDSGLANVSTALTSAVRKTPFFEMPHFDATNDHFTKTGSGQA